MLMCTEKETLMSLDNDIVINKVVETSALLMCTLMLSGRLWFFGEVMMTIYAVFNQTYNLQCATYKLPNQHLF